MRTEGVMKRAVFAVLLVMALLVGMSEATVAGSKLGVGTDGVSESRVIADTSGTR